jgi:hypothetical protein
MTRSSIFKAHKGVLAPMFDVDVEKAGEEWFKSNEKLEKANVAKELKKKIKELKKKTVSNPGVGSCVVRSHLGSNPWVNWL